MILGIVGSRGFTDYALLCRVVGQVKGNVSIIVSGGAKGADTLAEKYARERGIELIVYPPNWALYGKSAGFRRNQTIVAHSDAIVAFWDGASRGTAHTIECARLAGVPVYVKEY